MRSEDWHSQDLHQLERLVGDQNLIIQHPEDLRQLDQHFEVLPFGALHSGDWHLSTKPLQVLHRISQRSGD